MWGDKPARSTLLRQRLNDARDDQIKREEEADAAAVKLAEANESVRYAKERVSRLVSHLKVAQDEEVGKMPAAPDESDRA